ncbi:unnamed protein product [Nezara viridula]|uniref:Uncharacterized protein n=1 Tax=Nezara viridula TaxID=85310 RepID=A0A9P0H1V1_NEZVI|nr:unnamed protein product [Nezara viridula]
MVKPIVTGSKWIVKSPIFSRQRLLVLSAEEQTGVLFCLNGFKLIRHGLMSQRDTTVRSGRSCKRLRNQPWLSFLAVGNPEASSNLVTVQFSEYWTTKSQWK